MEDGGGIKRKEKSEAASHSEEGVEVMDGSDIMELVGNEEVFRRYVDHKFEELDRDKDGELSLNELEPAVSDIGAALGLPLKGFSPDSDLIYSEVLNEFTHGKQEKVSKTEFKVLSDILLGMAAGLKRDPVVILRIDGQDLTDFIDGPSYEPEMVSIFSNLDSDNKNDGDHKSLRDYIVKALEKLTVDHGMPPTDSWVMSSIVEPAMQSCISNNGSDIGGEDGDGNSITQEKFLQEFKKVGEAVARKLKEQPVIVAHTENTFDGSAIRRLLSNKFELDKTINAAIENVPKDRSGKMSKDYLRVALDSVAPSAGLPPFGAVDEVDKVVGEAFKMVNAGDAKMVKEEEFKKLLTEILESVMLQLEGNPISVSSNSVVHEPLSSSSTLFQAST